jgi:hypothetical protein
VLVMLVMLELFACLARRRYSSSSSSSPLHLLPPRWVPPSAELDQ